jgi:hypothetical protein
MALPEEVLHIVQVHETGKKKKEEKKKKQFLSLNPVSSLCFDLLWIKWSSFLKREAGFFDVL